MSRTKRVAALDIGSNSVMVLLADIHGDGRIEPINEFGAITRLGTGVNESKVLSQDAMNRTLDAIDETVRIVRSEGADTIIATATSAVREAINKAEFLVACRRRMNIFPQVLSGREEAELIYRGATMDFIGCADPLLVIDTGGGSTEIAYGGSQVMVAAHSVALGCVRLTEMFHSKASLLSALITSRTAHIRKIATPAMDAFLSWKGDRPAQVICCGGTATTLAAILGGMSFFDRAQINQTLGHLAETSVLLKRLEKMSLEERRAVKGMEPERAEVFPAGLNIIVTLLKYVRQDEFKISSNGLRVGVLRHYIEHNIL